MAVNPDPPGPPILPDALTEEWNGSSPANAEAPPCEGALPAQYTSDEWLRQLRGAPRLFGSGG